MKPIEETHPSLKGLYRSQMASTGQKSKLIRIHTDYLQKHTVDNQVLKKTLREIFDEDGNDYTTMKLLWDKLGLEEEE